MFILYNVVLHIKVGLYFAKVASLVSDFKQVTTICENNYIFNNNKLIVSFKIKKNEQQIFSKIQY